METREKQESVKRLLAYSTAAGLGAFTVGQTSQAAVVHVAFPPVTLNPPYTGTSTTTESFDLDIDGDTVADFSIQLVDFGNAYARVRGRSLDYNASLTNTAKGNAYYVRSFDFGDTVGFGNPSMAIVTGAGEVVKPSGDNVNNQPGFGRTAPSYMGIALHANGSPDYYFGWIRLQTTLDPPQDPPLPNQQFGVASSVTIYEFAYETQANTDIVIPEPGCLGLLAAGMGALGLRRRAV